MDFDQFLAATNDDLSHIFESCFQLSQGLFGITVGAVLHSSSFLTAAMNQRFTLLLSLLPKLQCIVVDALGFITTFLLKTQSFIANGF